MLVLTDAPVWVMKPPEEVNVQEGSELVITATALANPGPLRYAIVSIWQVTPQWILYVSTSIPSSYSCDLYLYILMYRRASHCVQMDQLSVNHLKLYVINTNVRYDATGTGGGEVRRHWRVWRVSWYWVKWRGPKLDSTPSTPTTLVGLSTLRFHSTYNVSDAYIITITVLIINLFPSIKKEGNIMPLVIECL